MTCVPSLVRRGLASARMIYGFAGTSQPLQASMPEPSPRRGFVLGAVGSGAAGLAASLLAMHRPNSRLRLDQIVALFGEGSFGPISHAVTATFEGALFGGCIVGAMILARRKGRGPG